MNLKILSIIACLLLLSISIANANSDFFFDKSVTVEQLAKKNELNTAKLIHELDDELGYKAVNPDSLIANIGLTKKQFRTLYLHMKEELTPIIIFAMFLWIGIAVLTILLLKKKKLTQNIRIVIFIFVILFFGIFLHSKPGAMESFVKLFKATAGKDTWHLKVLFFSFFSLFCIFASNIFCSIGCQVGVIQDFIFQLFRMKKIKHLKIPFLITNCARTILFIIFVLFMYNILTGLKSASLYHNMNLFKVYILHLSTIGMITLLLTITLSSVVYRPFCSIICPFGLWSWVLSHISIFKIKINHDECIKCKKCIQVCPNDSMNGIFNNETIKKDCYLCGECINQCPSKCIHL